MNPLAKAYCVLRYLGPGFVARRLQLSIKKRLGVTRRRFAPRPWDTIQLGEIVSPGIPTRPQPYVEYKSIHIPTFLFPFGEPPLIPVWDQGTECNRVPNLHDRLELLRNDRCIYFFNQPSPEGIDWYHNPFDDTQGDHRGIWCDVPDFSPEQGDPRVLWEPSRAAWALDVARARARGMEYPCGDVFWRWVDSWMTACPPFNGFQWKCGQESTVRLIAILIGFWAIGPEERDASRRWLQMARLAWATAYRIAHHIDYAVSQNNNHALSEACGLMLVAHLFPEFRDSVAWDQLGRRVLSDGMRRQIYPDGSYIQHSMNYHRVMLHVCTLALRIAELSGRPMAKELYDTLDRATKFLLQMMDPQSGQTPHYGNNDGACVLPLSACEFRDVRPALQSAHVLVHQKRLFAAGPWDEESLWLHGRAALDSPIEIVAQVSTAFRAGGYYTLHTLSSWLMARAHRHHDRPGQYDPLHVDLWWKGVNVLCDRGTYRYYYPSDVAVEEAFRSLSAHNGIEIDGRSPERWLGRFLHVPYSQTDLLEYRDQDEPLVWGGVSHDYARAPWRVTHSRTVIACTEVLWIIVDDLIGVGSQRVTARWQLPECSYRLEAAEPAVEFDTPQGLVTLRVCTTAQAAMQLQAALGRTAGGQAVGFAAPNYNSLVPAPTIEAAVETSLPVRVVTGVYLGCGAAQSNLTLSENGEVTGIGCRGRTLTLRLGKLALSPRSAFVRIESDAEGPTVASVHRPT